MKSKLLWPSLKTCTLILIFLILDLVSVTLTNGGRSKFCGGEDIKVKINGYKSGSQAVKVSCSVEKKPEVKLGETVIWNENNGFGNCKNINFDTTQGFLPNVQIMTMTSNTYCPKIVKLEIIKIVDLLPVKHTYCAKMSGFYANWKRNGRDNQKIHPTSENACE